MILSVAYAASIGGIAKLGKITIQERRVLAVFLLVAALWISRALWGKYLPMIMDSSIAIFGAFLLFLIPAGKEEALLKWNEMKKYVLTF